MSGQNLPSLRPAVATVCEAFLAGLRRELGEDFVALYLYGALTFADSQEMVNDIDFHVIVRHSLDDRLRASLQRLHGEVLAIDRSLDLDGYYIRLEDTQQTVPPPHQMSPLHRHAPSDESWALHCAHIRAGYVIRLHGPDPLDLYPEPTWPDLDAALAGEIRFVEHALPNEPAYAVLNACRLLYSYVTRDVVLSKAAAAGWAKDRFDEKWRPLIDAALAVYRKEGSASALRTEEVRRFVDMLWAEIARVR